MMNHHSEIASNPACSFVEPNNSIPPRHRSYRRRTVSTAKKNGGTTFYRPSSQQERRHQPHHLPPVTLCIPLALPATLHRSWILQTSTQVLVEYLLYARGLIPMSVTQLHQEKAAPSPSLSCVRRKITRTLQRLESFQQEWETFLMMMTTTMSSSSSCPTTIATIRRIPYILISLGPSFSRIQEYYLLDATGLLLLLPATTSTTGSISSTTNHPHALARRLLPKLIEQQVDLPSTSASGYQMWITVAVPSLNAFWERSVRPSEQPQQQILALQDKMIRRVGFQLPNALLEEHGNTTNKSHSKTTTTLPQQRRQPRRQKPQRLVKIHLSQKQTTTTTTNDAASTTRKRPTLETGGNTNNKDTVHDDDDELHWISLGTSIKGFRF